MLRTAGGVSLAVGPLFALGLSPAWVSFVAPAALPAAAVRDGPLLESLTRMGTPPSDPVRLAGSALVTNIATNVPAHIALESVTPDAPQRLLALRRRRRCCGRSGAGPAA